jgi:hypothetical protein
MKTLSKEKPDIDIYEELAKNSLVKQTIREASPHTDRLCATQGDVALMRLTKNITYKFENETVTVTPEKGDLIAEGKDVQIALGNTVGARHIVIGMKGVRVFKCKVAHPLLGPVIEVDKGCTAKLEHPEHAHWKLGPGLYQVSYPRDYQQADMAAQRD